MEYITLVHKNDTTKTPDKKAKENKKPFKKGSWKSWLYKKLSKYHSSKNTKDFHYIKSDNVIICKKNKPKLYLSSERPNDDLLEKLKTKYIKNSYVLINTGEGVFLRISMSCYLKLIEIERIAVNIHLKGKEDGEDEYFDVYEEDKVFDSINELLSWVNYYRQLVYGVGDIQCHCCWFTYVKYTVKTVIKKRDGTVEDYKGDFNEVLAEYGFDPLL